MVTDDDKADVDVDVDVADEEGKPCFIRYSSSWYNFNSGCLLKNTSLGGMEVHVSKVD